MDLQDATLDDVEAVVVAKLLEALFARLVVSQLVASKERGGVN